MLKIAISQQIYRGAIYLRRLSLLPTCLFQPKKKKIQFMSIIQHRFYLFMRFAIIQRSQKQIQMIDEQ